MALKLRRATHRVKDARRRNPTAFQDGFAFVTSVLTIDRAACEEDGGDGRRTPPPAIGAPVGCRWLLLALLITGCGGTVTSSSPRDAGLPQDASTDHEIDAPSLIQEAGVPEAGACNAATCPGGCCDGTSCVTPTSPEQCGSEGQACIACDQGAICKGTCVRPQENCGPSNCTGCCGPNTCSVGTSDVACGNAGAPCTRCVPSEGTGQCVANPNGMGGTCTDQACGPKTCPAGCCTAAGECVYGESPTACGQNGAACVDCGGSMICVGGTCMVGTPCTPQNCAGCCGGQTGNTCLAGTDDGACGTGGFICQNCATFKQTCTMGSCGVPCSPSTCPGCCYGAICAQGDQAQYCGSGGATCSDCAMNGKSCVAMACQ